MKRAYEILCVTSRMEVEADARHLPNCSSSDPLERVPRQPGLSFSRELLFPPPPHRYVLPCLASHLAAGDLNSWGLWPEGKHFANSPTSSPTYTHMDTFLCSPLFLQIYFSLRVAGSLSHCHKIFWCVRLPKFICPPLGVYVGCFPFELL